MPTRVLRPGEVYAEADLVRLLVAEQFPHWAGQPVEPIPSTGTDNAMYRLGPDMVVRLPRFSRWADQVGKEQRWLPVLAPHLPLAVPVPLAMGHPAHGYPWNWSVYQWLDGENPTVELLADPRAAAGTLARFLTALWNLDATAGPPPAPHNAFRGMSFAAAGATDSVAADGSVRTRIAALSGLVDTDALLAGWDAAVHAPAWAGPPRWSHGDLHGGNLLAAGRHLHAIIDFGCLGVGDPACDLMVAWAFLDSGARAALRAALDVDDATWARGRGWGLAMVLTSPDRLTEATARRLAEFAEL